MDEVEIVETLIRGLAINDFDFYTVLVIVVFFLPIVATLHSCVWVPIFGSFFLDVFGWLSSLAINLCILLDVVVVWTLLVTLALPTRR